jgi:hypothetical protein
MLSAPGVMEKLGSVPLSSFGVPLLSPFAPSVQEIENELSQIHLDQLHNSYFGTATGSVHRRAPFRGNSEDEQDDDDDDKMGFSISLSRDGAPMDSDAELMPTLPAIPEKARLRNIPPSPIGGSPATFSMLASETPDATSRFKSREDLFSPGTMIQQISTPKSVSFVPEPELVPTLTPQE